MIAGIIIILSVCLVLWYFWDDLQTIYCNEIRYADDLLKKDNPWMQ